MILYTFECAEEISCREFGRPSGPPSDTAFHRPTTYN